MTESHHGRFEGEKSLGRPVKCKGSGEEHIRESIAVGLWHQSRDVATGQRGNDVYFLVRHGSGPVASRMVTDVSRGWSVAVRSGSETLGAVGSCVEIEGSE